MEPGGIMKAFPKVKRMRESPQKEELVKKRKVEDALRDDWLKPVTAHIIQAGIGRARAEIFQKQIIQKGGRVCNSFSSEVTHIIVDEGMDCDRAFRILKVDKICPGAQLLKSSWLSLCIKENKIVDTAGYRIFISDRYLDADHRVQKEHLVSACNTTQLKTSDGRKESTTEEQADEMLIAQPSPESQKTAAKEMFSTAQEACQIRGIGKKMAEKIEEILESGHLRKIDHIDESVGVMEIFSNIWGAGVKTAQLWYQQGFRTLDDIRTKATLTNQQTIGLKYYEELLDRMPREEAAEIEQTVRLVAHTINPGLLAIACGSYRRGKLTCGDVDVLITHPDEKSHKGVFGKLIELLKERGFLTDDLVSQEDSGSQKKYMGVCLLPGVERKHRRLDVIIVPYSEFACSLMYFTGSAHFNRSMRALAKTKGMSLSEHSLNKDVVHSGSLKVSTGFPLPTKSEKDVFELLGLPYREPQERDW